MGHSLHRGIYSWAKSGASLVVPGLIISALIIFAPTALRAEEKVAVVDVQRVVNESIIGKAARSNMESQIQKAKVKLGNLQADLEKGKADLQKQAGILSGSALEERKESLGKKQVEAQRVYQDMQEQLAKANDKEIRKVIEEIQKVIDELADDKDYTFIFERDRQSVLYANPQLDITQEVVKILDKKKIDL
jgi:outer membrane protein